MRKFSVAILSLILMISCSERELKTKNESGQVYYVNNAFYCEVVESNMPGTIRKCINNEAVCYVVGNFNGTSGISCYSTLKIDDGKGRK